MENKDIKTIIPTECPHCHQTIFVEMITQPTRINPIYTLNDVTMAKNDVRERIKSLSRDDDKKASAIDWVNSEETIFGPSEVDEIIKTLLQPDIK